MATPRDVLNEFKWRHDALRELLVWYVHRGAPDDRRAVAGADVVELGRSFMAIRAPEGLTMIPYHRVTRIERAGAPVWVRRPASVVASTEEE